MKPIKLLALALTLMMALFISCQKEFSGLDNPSIDIGNGQPNVVATVKGRIVDEQGKPVASAEVKAGTATAQTNINGEFVLSNAHLFDKAAFVKVTKAGYFAGSRTFMTGNGETAYIEIKLLLRKTDGIVSSSSGGTVSLSNGASVTLPAAGIINKSTGAAYSGNVNVSAVWINPTSPELQREMPGDLRGITSANEERGLESYGMMGVELTGTAGEELQIATGKKATLKFPLPARIAGRAPASIPLWHFNDTTGFWKEEGAAIKTGNTYSAEVAHFSFWNCDAPFPVVDFTATVKDQNNQPIPFAQVRIKRDSANGRFSYTYANTDAAGKVKGKVPANEILVLEIISTTCGNVAHTQNIGPLTSATNISITVNISGAQTATISGTAVTCNNTPVTNGWVELVVGTIPYRTNIANGNFTFQISLCVANQAASLVIVDVASNQQSASKSLTLNPGNNDAGSLTACGISSNQFINYTVAGASYAYAPPTDSLQAYFSSNTTSISGSNSSGGSYNGIGFAFTGNTTGTFPLSYLNLSVPGLDSSIMQSPISVIITEYGQQGQFVAGSFSGNVRNMANTTYPVQCTFRVKRRF